MVSHHSLHLSFVDRGVVQLEDNRDILTGLILEDTLDVTGQWPGPVC